jgi:hypothetical protein
MPKRFPKFGRLVILLIVTPIVLGWGELFTRALLEQKVDSRLNIFESDAVIGFIYKPLSKRYEKGREYNALYQISSVGLRDREYGPKKDGVFRILLVGDSFSVSHGLSIEDSLSRQIEGALQHEVLSSGKKGKIEVINASVGGYSPYNYWKAYHKWAPVFKPDAVLVGLSPDDYECSDETVRYLIENGETMGVSTTGEIPKRSGKLSLKKIRKWLSWNSEFYVLMRNFLYYNDLGGRITLAKNPGGIENDTQFKMYLTSQAENVPKAYSKTFSYLKKLKNDTDSDGVGLAIISVPLKMEIDVKEYNNVILSKYLKKDDLDINLPFKVIAKFCLNNQIPILDPRPAIRRRQAEKPCYFMYDGHWNAEGVHIAASSIATQWLNIEFSSRTNLKIDSFGRNGKDYQ